MTVAGALAWGSRALARIAARNAAAGARRLAWSIELLQHVDELSFVQLEAVASARLAFQRASDSLRKAFP